MSEFLKTSLDIIPRASEFKTLAEYKHWKAVVTSIKEGFELDDTTLLIAINLRISGKIVQILDNRKFLTIEQFWAHMDRAHGIAHDLTSRIKVLQDFMYPPDSIQTMADYIFHFEECFGKLPGVFDNEGDRILHFLMPLNPVISNFIEAENPQTLEDTKKLAISSSVMLPDRIFREEIRDYQTNNTNESSFTSSNASWKTAPPNNHQANHDMSTKQCHFCGKIGHYAANCRIRKDNDTQSAAPSHTFGPRNNRRGNSKARRRARNFSTIKEYPKH